MEFPPVAEATVFYNGKKFNNNFYPLDQIPPKEAGDLINFYHIWRNSNLKITIPSRKDLPFEKLVGWHSKIRLVDLENSTPEADKIIITGSIFDNHFGKETMRTEIANSQNTNPETLENYKQFLKYFHNNHYNIGVGSSPNPDSRIRQLIWIDLPLSNDGIKISHMLTALIPMK